MKKLSLDWTLITLSGVAFTLAGIAWWKGGQDLALEGLRQGFQTLVSVTPMLLAAFLTAGLTNVLISKELVERWLAAGTGWRGILIGCIGGALIPGGPYVYYPIAGSLLQSGAGLGVLVAFVTAKNLWSISRLPYEFALLGPPLTLVRYALTLIFPPLLGYLAETLFGNSIERIREAVQ